LDSTPSAWIFGYRFRAAGVPTPALVQEITGGFPDVELTLLELDIHSPTRDL